MGRLEGSRRMQSAGRKITGVSVTVFTVTIAIVISFFAWVGYAPDGAAAARYFALFPLFLYSSALALLIALFGTVLWLAGWIAEGFAAVD